MTQAVSDEVERLLRFVAGNENWQAIWANSSEMMRDIAAILAIRPKPSGEVTKAMIEAGEATYDAVPDGANAHRVALGKVYLAMRPHDPDVKALVEALENIRDDSNQVVGRRGGLDPKLSRICETADAALAPFEDRGMTR